MRAFLSLPLLLLAACEGEAENVQATSVERERLLEQRYKEIEAEAENDVAAQVAPLDNEADALLEQLNSNAAASANAVDSQ